MRRSDRFLYLFVAALAVQAVIAAPAQAQLSFTAAGQSLFPTESKYIVRSGGYYGDPNAVATGGGGLFVDFGNQLGADYYIKTDQALTNSDFAGGNSNVVQVNAGFGTATEQFTGATEQLATLGNYVYIGGASPPTGSGLVRLSISGSTPQVSAIGSTSSAWGVAADASNNTIYSTTSGSAYNHIMATNASTGATTTFFTGGYLARIYSLALSQDSSTLYVAYDPETGPNYLENIIGIRISDGSIVYRSQNFAYGDTIGLLDVTLGGTETLLATGTTTLPGTTTQTDGLWSLDTTTGAGTLLAYADATSTLMRSISYDANLSAVLVGQVDVADTPHGEQILFALNPQSTSESQSVPEPRSLALFAFAAALAIPLHRQRARAAPRAR